jgi:hypothetical protein
MTEMSIAQIYDALPCLQCMDERAGRIRLRIGALYLTIEQQRRLPQVPPRDQLLQGCCKKIQSWSYGA